MWWSYVYGKDLKDIDRQIRKMIDDGMNVCSIGVSQKTKDGGIKRLVYFD